MEIAGRRIGTDLSPYIVAEIGAGWSPERPLDSCLELMEAAREAGADAVKIQVYKPEDLTIDALPPLAEGPWAGMTLWEIYERGSLPEEIVPGLFEAARNMGITLFSSVFSKRAIPMLESLGCPAYKIASAELCHDELLWAVEETYKPVIMSTGMADLDEVYHAYEVFSGEVALLHCIAQYPASADDAEFGKLTELRHRFDRELVGLSDHTHGATAAVAAIALGATIIEKHIALPMTLDSEFALRPHELPSFVSTVRTAWNALQTPQDGASPSKSLIGLRRSIRATRDIASGEKLTRENIAVLRPAGGAIPQSLDLLLGAHAGRDFKKGEGVN